SGSSRQVAALKGHRGSVTGCTWSSDGVHIAARDDNNALRVWDGRKPQPLLLDGTDFKTTNVKPLFSPDSRWLLAHTWRDCGVWDVGSGVYLPLQFQRNGDGDFVSAAAFSPESTHLAIGYVKGPIRIWYMATRCDPPLLLNAHRTNDVAFSPDGRLLLSASWDGTVKIWDAYTGAIVRSLEGHTSPVCTASFSPCGKYIASASSDETVRVWRASDGSCLATLSDHDQSVLHVAFTPDGTGLWSAAANGTVLGRRLQDVAADEFIF
ncbi:WD40 repeat-like protein, partial [Dichomitus squalens LYAD-421 SS1]